MNNENNLRPLVIFFMLSLIFALLIALPSILENYGFIDADIPLIPLLLVGSWTPNLAAFIVILFVLKQRGGVKNLFRRWLMWKASLWWHLPLWFAGLGWENMSFAVFTWNCIAMAVILTWICNNTRGNMVLVTLFHMFYNYGFGLMNDVWNVPPEKGIIYLAGVLTVYVAVVLVIYGPGRLSRKDTLPIDMQLKSWVLQMSPADGSDPAKSSIPN